MTIEKTKKNKAGNLRYLINHQFGKTFAKNWAVVFLCIAVPLLICSVIIHDYSRKSILNEIDADIKRSAENTTATIVVLLDEANLLLKKTIINDYVVSICTKEPPQPVDYSEIQKRKRVLDIVSSNYRESLYYSVDLFSSCGELIISSLGMAQNYENTREFGLKEGFFEGNAEHPNQNMFARLRVVKDRDGRFKRLITVYLTSPAIGNRSFISISIDNDKLKSYVSSDKTYSNGSYLLIDEKNNIVFDTSSQLLDETFDFDMQMSQGGIMTALINGQNTMVYINDLGKFGWKFAQLIPLEELQANSKKLFRLLVIVIIIALLAATVISYYVTNRLFRPVTAIINILEDPDSQSRICEENDEYQYLLVQILELFQKNITLETTMAERTIALKSARAKALQKQMTPHFLNNVLQSINWIAIRETGKFDSETTKAITLLADIIRMGKEQSDNLTTVSDEMAYTEKFIELERLRFGDGIQYDIDIPPELGSIQIPCFSIQVLVENSLLHGLQPMGGNGKIIISALMSEEGYFVIRVMDNGTGMDKDAINHIGELMKEEFIYIGTNLGLVNLFQRYRLIFGDSCIFNYGNLDEGGSLVEIKVPVEELQHR